MLLQGLRHRCTCNNTFTTWHLLSMQKSAARLAQKVRERTSRTRALGVIDELFQRAKRRSCVALACRNIVARRVWVLARFFIRAWQQHAVRIARLQAELQVWVEGLL